MTAVVSQTKETAIRRQRETRFNNILDSLAQPSLIALNMYMALTYLHYKQNTGGVHKYMYSRQSWTEDKLVIITQPDLLSSSRIHIILWPVLIRTTSVLHLSRLLIYFFYKSIGLDTHRGIPFTYLSMCLSISPSSAAHDIPRGAAAMQALKALPIPTIVPSLQQSIPVQNHCLQIAMGPIKTASARPINSTYTFIRRPSIFLPLSLPLPPQLTASL